MVIRIKGFINHKQEEYRKEMEAVEEVEETKEETAVNADEQPEEEEIYPDEELDLSPLSNLTELRAIDLSARSENGIDVSFFDVNLKDYSFLYSLHQLQDVDLSCLENLERIEKIDIEGYHIRNAESFANLSHIKQLGLFEYDEDEDKRLTFDMHILDGMTELEGLSLYFIDVEDISPLANKRFLESITLVDTGIGDIEPLKNLNILRWLAVWGNDSDKVQEQSELYFQDVETVSVIDGIPVEVWEL